MKYFNDWDTLFKKIYMESNIFSNISVHFISSIKRNCIKSITYSWRVRITEVVLHLRNVIYCIVLIKIASYTFFMKLGVQ